MPSPSAIADLLDWASREAAKLEADAAAAGTDGAAIAVDAEASKLRLLVANATARSCASISPNSQRPSCQGACDARNREWHTCRSHTASPSTPKP